MMIRLPERAFAIRFLQAGAVALIIAGLVGSGPASAADDTDNTSTASSSHDSQGSSDGDKKNESVTSALIKIQQSHYQHLHHLWTERHVPSGLPDPTGAVSARDSNTPTVGIRVKNVNYEIADGIGFYVKSLAGALVPDDKSEPVDFDDPYSYKIHIYKGEVTVRPKELDALFNRYILTYSPRALSSVENHTSDGKLTVDAGTRIFDFLPPIGGVPTTLVGPMRVTDDGKLAYTPKTVKNLGLPVRGLLSKLGIKLSTLTPLDRKGAHLDGNTLILDPQTIFPEPTLVIDHIDSAKLTDKGLTLTFSSDKGNPKFDDPPVDTDSYIWLQSGDARFFNVVLINARLLVTNEDHKRLHFHLYRYRSQVAAGRIDVLADGTLITRVPNDIETDNAAPHITENAKPKAH